MDTVAIRTLSVRVSAENDCKYFFLLFESEHNCYNCLLRTNEILYIHMYELIMRVKQILTLDFVAL